MPTANFTLRVIPWILTSPHASRFHRGEERRGNPSPGFCRPADVSVTSHLRLVAVGVGLLLSSVTAPQEPGSRQTLQSAPSNSTRCKNPNRVVTGNQGVSFPCHKQVGKLSWATPGLQIKLIVTIFLELAHEHGRLVTHSTTAHDLSKTFFIFFKWAKIYLNSNLIKIACCTVIYYILLKTKMTCGYPN